MAETKFRFLPSPLWGGSTNERSEVKFVRRGGGKV
jgi:hypothetical protein